jgi:YHS domain-containing protein
MAKDLVCDMDVDEKTAKWKSTYKGKTYYFCAPAANPSSMRTQKNTSAAQEGTRNTAAAAAETAKTA